MNTQTPTPRTDVKQFEAVMGIYPDGSNATESVVNSDFARTLERELAEKDARIAELESQRENWRMSSVCREKDAQIVALLEALQECKNRAAKIEEAIGNGHEGIQHESSEIECCVNVALFESNPPPVVPLEDVKQLVEALKELGDGVYRLSGALDSCRDGPTSAQVLQYDRCSMANDCLTTFTTKHPIN